MNDTIATFQRISAMVVAIAAPLSPNNSAITENVPSLLTDRERQIMTLVSDGLSNKEIARRLNIADGTIKVHLHHIFQKLEISNRTVLAALALSLNDDPGLVPGIIPRIRCD